LPELDPARGGAARRGAAVAAARWVRAVVVLADLAGFFVLLADAFFAIVTHLLERVHLKYAAARPTAVALILKFNQMHTAHASWIREHPRRLASRRAAWRAVSSLRGAA
jgi:hypothetical protein